MPGQNPGKGPIRVGTLIGGIAIAVVALVLLLSGIGAQTASVWLNKRNPVAETQGPGKLSFDASDNTYVIALGTSEESWSNFELSKSERWEKFRVYDGDVNAARCTIDHPSGKDERKRGDRQVTSVTLGVAYASVGRFDGRGGKTTVECTFDPPTVTRFGDGENLGKRKVERTVPFMVHRTGGWLSTLGWIAIGAAVLLGALALWLILKATALRKPR